MEKLKKVIEGLTQCYYGKCTNCPYEFSGDMSCHDAVNRDALEMLTEMSADNQRLLEMWAEATKNLSIAVAEREEARREAMKLEAELCGLKWGV